MKKTLLLLCIVVFTGNLRANDSQYLISEMEALRDSLKVEDPARIDLTLRLADLYFDVSIQEGKGEDQDALKKNRLKAFELYKQSLNGTDSLKKATGLNKIKIQFQMARLLSRLDEGKMAESYYLDIIANNESPKKMVEQSALALAEWHEDEAKYPEAKKYYDKAVANCSDRNSCNYANYRLGWLYYKDTKLDDAIVTMEKSLWTDETTIRENSLTDLLLFVSNKDKTDGTRELEMIRKIATKAKRPELVRQLVEAFYVAGNRFAGSNLLAELNKEDPNVYYEVRLLEEFYGFRKWDKVQQYLSIIEKRKPADLPKKIEEAKEVQTILRRFIVQVDAEMQVVADLKSVLKRSIDSYLSLYPKDEMRTKMQAGWLAVVEDKNEKMAKLDSWIKEDIALKIDSLETRKLRQARLAMAQETKNSKIIIEDAIGIAEILKGTKEADEFYYVGAREQYVSKNSTSALQNFKTVLTNSKSRKEITKWTILSQNLTLDIYNSQKNYDGIVSQVGFWKELVAIVPMTEEISKETKSMDQILVQAQFEKAFTLKDTKLALDSFYNFCMTGQYPEKSCPNAKVLSVKFKDQEKLVNVLEKMDDKESLAIELELMGRFSDAASVREKFELTTANAQNFLNIAFLYELDQNLNERDRVLANMVDVFKSEKKLPAELEKATFVALDEANLINEKTLLMPWSPGMKIKIASRLEVESPSVETKKALLSVNEGHGAVWAKVVLSKLEEDFNSTNKIKFYGTQSKKLFKQRTTTLDKFASTAKPMLDSADLETRVYILHMLKMAYKNIANEILNTPIPDGLDAQTLNQVTTQISTMADPFDRVNEDYDRLITEQLAAMTDVSVKEKVTKNLTGAVANYSSFIELSGNEKGEKYSAVKMDHNPANLMRKKLLVEPEDKKTLIGLKDYYTLNKNPRFAAYYASRVENLKQVE